MASDSAHPSLEVALRYVADRPSDAERLHIDLHLADCEPCRSEIRALRQLREHGAAPYLSWTAADYGRAYRHWQLAKALRQMGDASAPDVVRRALRWLKRLATGAGQDIKVLLDGARSLAAATAHVPTGCKLVHQLAYAGVGSPEEVGRLRQHLERGNELLLEGRAEESTGELLQAVAIDARCPQAAVAEVHQHGMRVLQLLVDSRRRRVAVKVYAAPGGSLPSLSALLALDAAVPPRVVEFLPIEGEAAVVAEFDDVPDGVYAIELDGEDSLDVTLGSGA